MNEIEFSGEFVRQEQGYVLLGTLVLLMLSAFIIFSALNVAGTTTRSQGATNIRNNEYYEAEEGLNKAVSWLRKNSASLVLAFSSSNFYQNFDKSSSTVGTNDQTLFPVPSMIKIRNTNKSVVLSNDSALIVPEFPSTINLTTGQQFDAKTAFANDNFGSTKLRVTLVNAVPYNSALDYGDPDNGASQPGTDFNQVFRVDSFRSQTEGAHVFGYITGAMTYNYGVGFYGQDLVDLRQSCDSYLSNNGAYTTTNRRANCPVGAGAGAQVHQNAPVYGTLKAQGAITKTSPYGGAVCADFNTGCPNKGETCEGTACNVPGLPTYSTWATFCPSNQGNVTVSANITMTVAGNAANQKCWATVKVNSSRTLTLRTTSYSYFIDTFDIANNAKVNFSPDPASGTINLYVRKFVGDMFNGNQIFNTNNKPYQLRIHYLGTSPLTLNGTAAMSAFIVAPYAPVTVSGSFIYSGGIKAKSLSVTGSGKLRYDESGDITTLSDVTFKYRNVHERNR